MAKSTASFFGLDEETEHNSYQRWTERRRRLLSKKWGELKVNFAFILYYAPKQIMLKNYIEYAHLIAECIQRIVYMVAYG